MSSPAPAWTVLEGDCLDLLPTLADKSVDHVITDPPYSEHTHSKQRRGRGSMPDGGEFPCRQISEAREIGFASLSPEDMVAYSALFAAKALRWVLAFCDLESTGSWIEANTLAGLQHVRVGIWQKLCAAPQFTGDRPASAAEAVVISHRPGRKRWNGGGAHALWAHPIVLNRGGLNPRLHTTQKPLPLMLELVELFTDPGDLVLDPFCGSGTTGVACLRLGRRFIGIEKDAGFAQVARERLEAESQGLTLRAARAGQMPLFGGAK